MWWRAAVGVGALVIGVLAALEGSWVLVLGMTLVAAGQAVGVLGERRRPSDDRHHRHSSS